MPERIQMTRNKPWRHLHPDAITVSRPSKWGNPYRFRTPYALARVPALDGSAWEYEGRISADGMRHDYHHPDGHISVHHIRYMTLAECVEMYRRALVEPTPQIHLWAGQGKPWLSVEQAREELAGKDLACWCKLPAPGEPDVCHAAVLLSVANPAMASAGEDRQR